MRSSAVSHDGWDRRGAALNLSADSEADSLLLGGVQRGDERALAAFYDRWVNQVYSIAVHLLGDHGDAEDVVERTFSQVRREAGGYTSTTGSAGAWIVLMARSQAQAQRRTFDGRVRHDEA